MARACFLILVVAGVLASMMGRGAPSPAPERQALVVANQAEEPDGDRAGATLDDLDSGAVRLERSANGHFYADVLINGASIRALVDTGASGIALSREDARSAGVATSIGMPNVVGRGADGDVRGEFVTLATVSLGDKTVEDMNAMVLNAGEQSLLGQDFLSRFAAVEIRGDTMVLR